MTSFTITLSGTPEEVKKELQSLYASIYGGSIPDAAPILKNQAGETISGSQEVPNAASAKGKKKAAAAEAPAAKEEKSNVVQMTQPAPAQEEPSLEDMMGESAPAVEKTYTVQDAANALKAIVAKKGKQFAFDTLQSVTGQKTVKDLSAENCKKLVEAAAKVA